MAELLWGCTLYQEINLKIDEWEMDRVPPEQFTETFFNVDIPNWEKKVHSKAAQRLAMVQQFWEGLQDTFRWCWPVLTTETDEIRV